MKKLNIAILASLKRPVTPTTTVSRNRVIADLAMGLVKKGHKVTIFGTADSMLPNVELVEVVPRGLNFIDLGENPFYTETAYITHSVLTLLEKQEEFDLIHNHMYPEFLPLLARASLRLPIITTIHAQITDTLKMVFLDLKIHNSLVCISNSAKKRLGLPTHMVYNGVDTELFSPPAGRNRSYFLFVGRMSKAKDKNGKFIDPKGVQNAISAIERIGDRLRIVGNVEDGQFYDELIAPHLSEKIQFVGEVSKEQELQREELVELYRGAKALLFPINWEEPFGLVMIEAMSCGTPIVAFDRGSVPEIVVDGETGFVVDHKIGIDGLADAIKKLNKLPQEEYREMSINARIRVEENFSVDKMVENYEKLYRKIIEEEANG